MKKRFRVNFFVDELIFFLGMIDEAEKFADEDKALKEKVDARNGFESYIYQMKNTVEDKEKLG